MLSVTEVGRSITCGAYCLCLSESVTRGSILFVSTRSVLSMTGRWGWYTESVLGVTEIGGTVKRGRCIVCIVGGSITREVHSLSVKSMGVLYGKGVLSLTEVCGSVTREIYCL